MPLDPLHCYLSSPAFLPHFYSRSGTPGNNRLLELLDILYNI